MEIKTIDDIFGKDFIERKRLSGKIIWNDGKSDVEITFSTFDIDTLQVEGLYINPYKSGSDFRVNLDYKTKITSPHSLKYGFHGQSKLDDESFKIDASVDEAIFNEGDVYKLAKYFKCARYNLFGYLRLAKQFAREKLGIRKFSPGYKEVREARRNNSWKRFITEEKGICQCDYAVIFPIKEIKEKGARKKVLY